MASNFVGVDYAENKFAAAYYYNGANLIGNLESIVAVKQAAEMAVMDIVDGMVCAVPVNLSYTALKKLEEEIKSTGFESVRFTNRSTALLLSLFLNEPKLQENIIGCVFNGQDVELTYESIDDGMYDVLAKRCCSVENLAKTLEELKLLKDEKGNNIFTDVKNVILASDVSDSSVIEEIFIKVLGVQIQKVSPEQVVTGATIECGVLEGNSHFNEVILLDMTPYTIEAIAPDGSRMPLLKDITIPTKVTKELPISTFNGNELTLSQIGKVTIPQDTISKASTVTICLSCTANYTEINFSVEKFKHKELDADTYYAELCKVMDKYIDSGKADNDSDLIITNVFAEAGKFLSSYDKKNIEDRLYVKGLFEKFTPPSEYCFKEKDMWEEAGYKSIEDPLVYFDDNDEPTKRKATKGFFIYRYYRKYTLVCWHASTFFDSYDIFDSDGEIEERVGESDCNRYCEKLGKGFLKKSLNLLSYTFNVWKKRKIKIEAKHREEEQRIEAKRKEEERKRQEEANRVQKQKELDSIAQIEKYVQHAQTKFNFGSFTDPRDGQTYRTIKIGKQVWMAENLRYKTEGGRADDGKGSIACNADANFGKAYGRLYTWAAAMNLPEKFNDQQVPGGTLDRIAAGNLQGIAPDGWHIPSKTEIQQMLDFVEENSNSSLSKALRAPVGWISSDGQDELGMGFLGSGQEPISWVDEISSRSTANLMEFVRIWTTTINECNPSFTSVALEIKNDSAELYSEGKGAHLSVRCVKDLSDEQLSELIHQEAKLAQQEQEIAEAAARRRHESRMEKIAEQEAEAKRRHERNMERQASREAAERDRREKEAAEKEAEERNRCKYCGRHLGYRYSANVGGFCPDSPTKKHILR